MATFNDDISRLKGSSKSSSSGYVEPSFSPDFQDRANAINETYSGSQVKQSFWDRLQNFFGARSSYDVQHSAIEQERRQALLQLKTLEAEQGYNSEQAKVDRMRAAGLNPDLQGLGESSDASEFSEPDASVDFSGLTTGQELFSDVASAFQSSLSIFSTLQSLKQQHIEIANSELRSADDSAALVSNIFKSIENPQTLLDFLKFQQGDDSEIFFNDIPDLLFKHLGIRSPRARRIAKTRVRTYLSSVLGNIDRYETLDKYIKAKDSFLKSESTWYRSGEGFSMDFDSSIRSFLKEWSDFQHDVEKAQLRFTKSYFSKKSGAAAAAAENAENRFTSGYYSDLDSHTRAAYENSSAQFAQYVNSKKEELYKKLVGKGDTFSLLMAVQLMGDVNLLQNSGITKAIGKASGFIF